MPTEFVHLHLHSDYSLLDGACSVKGILNLTKELQMPAVAMTDHGCMGGAIDFYKTLSKSPVKPIIGCEMYVSPTTRFDKDQTVKNIRGFHLVLLSKDLEGYRNLCKLVAVANIEGFYHKPRIDHEILSKYSKGLIGLSACLKGKIADNINYNRLGEAKKALGEYLDIFDKGDFYLEIMDHGIPEQKKINKELIKLSKSYDVPLVATNDVHYLKKEHAKSHELMLCIQTRTTLSDEKRFRFSSDEFYLKNGDEMLEMFRDTPEAISNTLEVAEKCNLVIPFVPEVNHYPVYEIQGDQTRKAYLRNICLDAMQERYDFDPREQNELDEFQTKIIDRLDYELGIIDHENYCSYFLVVWDFIRYALKTGVPVGPGRGSGAGSIVAYLTHITDIDPIRYNLLFERFLNPERVSPPDFDIDMCERRRSEVIDYVRRKYGNDRVAQIGTYGTLKAKAVIKDTVRALAYPFGRSNMITKLIPNDPKMTLAKALEENPDLKKMYDEENWVKEVFEYAKPLEGLNRNMSIHAAGVIIGDQPLDELVPLARGAGNEVITQFPAGPCEELGLLKMDFLGLRTLTVIQDAIDNIKNSQNIDIDFSKIPLTDEKAFALLNRGDTVGVFQLESPGMRDLCRRFGVEKIEEIIALIAIYRPGPMQFIDSFIKRKKGQEKVEYDHPYMEELLNETYGIMLYQEQIMQVVQKVAGFSLGQADILRRAMGKKKVDVMAEQKSKFVKGCAETCGLDTRKSENIWEKIAKFAGYGFNKSHSAAYAFLAYRTAYLKANYPVEFMAAVLSSEVTKAEKVASFLKECREMGIKVLPPDINKSYMLFSVDGENIRFGLAAIKGVGETAASSIIEIRKQHGEFKTFIDFCEFAGAKVNSRILEAFCRTGAFDSFGLKRSQLLATFDQTMALGQSLAKDKASGQGSLFDLLDEEDKSVCDSVDIPDIPELPEQEILQNEKDLLGFYVTGHPLGEYAEIIKVYSTHSLIEVVSNDEAIALPNETGVKVGGIITSVEHRKSKAGNPFGIFSIEDLEGSCECLIFNSKVESKDKSNDELNDKAPKLYDISKDFLFENAPIFIEALVDAKDTTRKLIVKRILPMNMVQNEYTKEVHVRMFEGNATKQMLEKIKEVCLRHSGKSLLIFCITTVSGEIAFLEAAKKYSVSVSKELIREISEIVGEGQLHYKADKTVPQAKRKPWQKYKIED
jgi:DNA polymerase-3 subunit alpha